MNPRLYMLVVFFAVWGVVTGLHGIQALGKGALVFWLPYVPLSIFYFLYLMERDK